MITQMYFEGGTGFMSIIYLMWIVVFALTIRCVFLYFVTKNPQKLKRTNNSILFIGSLTFLIGVTGQMIGLVAAFDSVQMAGEVSPALLAGGLKVTFITPLFGLSLLIISGIIWFVFQNLKYSGE